MHECIASYIWIFTKILKIGFGPRIRILFYSSFLSYSLFPPRALTSRNGQPKTKTKACNHHTWIPHRWRDWSLSLARRCFMQHLFEGKVWLRDWENLNDFPSRMYGDGPTFSTLRRRSSTHRKTQPRRSPDSIRKAWSCCSQARSHQWMERVHRDGGESGRHF